MLDDRIVFNFQDLGRLTMMGDINDPVFAYFNPSIAYDGKGKLRINIRACTFRPISGAGFDYRDGGNHSKTKNLYGYLDPKTFAVTKLQEIKYDDRTPRDVATISGLEDARLFWRDDGMHFIGVRTDTRPYYRYPAQQAEFVYDEATNTLKYIDTWLGPSPARGEKNWLPPDVPSDLFDFNYSPTEIYKDKKVVGVRYDGYIHGSSQLLWQPKTKTYIAVLHSKHADPLIVGKVYDKMLYVHYFAEFNQEGYLIRLSDPFTFGLADNIEFVSGMVEHSGDLLMSLGAGDSRWGLARISKERATNLLKPYTALEREPIKELTRPQHKYIQYQHLEARR